MIQSYSKCCHNLGALLEMRKAELGSLEHLGKAMVVTFRVLHNQKWSFECRWLHSFHAHGRGQISQATAPSIQLPSGTPCG